MLASAAVWFLIWGQIIHIVLQSGILWSLLGAQLSNIPERRVEATLFAQAEVPRERVVAIGDSTFQEEIAKQLPGDLSITRITHEWMDLESLTVLLSKIEFAPDQIILVQNIPAYWSDVRTDFWVYRDAIRPRHRTPLWDNWTGIEGEGIVPRYRREARIVIDTFHLWARYGRLHAARSKAQRLSSYFQIGFIPPEEKLEFVFKAPTWGAIVQYTEEVYTDPSPDQFQLSPYVAPLPGNFTRRLYWVSDLNDLPEDTRPDLVDGFKRYFRAGTFNERLGHFVSFESLPSIVKRHLEGQ